jgi:integrase
MLTDTFIKSLRPAPLLKKHFDGNGTGLHLISHPGGKRTFAIKYLHPFTRKEQTLNVGEYPSTTLKNARDQAINTRVLLAQGIDPREQRAVARLKEKAAVIDTFKNVGLDWMQVRGAGWSESYRNKTETMLDRHLFSSLGSIPITQITAPQLLAVLRPIEATGKTDLAHTLMQHAGAIFRFAMATARGIADPASALRGALAPHKQENFPAITDPDEFAELLVAMDCYKGEYITRAAMEFTLLTFQRSQSIRFARWDQIDWNAKLWRIPAEIMKMKDPHVVPLSRQTEELLVLIRPLTGEGVYIFPSLTDRRKTISENTMLYALVRLGYRGRMTVHGFRTSASTLLNENGHHPDVIEAALAHTRGDIRSIYNKAKYLPERRTMYQWWADHCDELRQHKKATAQAKRTIHAAMDPVLRPCRSSANARLLTCAAGAFGVT